jgi:hypothetical protein
MFKAPTALSSVEKEVPFGAKPPSSSVLSNRNSFVKFMPPDAGALLLENVWTKASKELETVGKLVYCKEIAKEEVECVCEVSGILGLSIQRAGHSKAISVLQNSNHWRM